MEIIYNALKIFAGFIIGMIISLVFLRPPAPDPVIEYLPAPELSEWSIFQMAVIKTESEFNHLAVGHTKDVGLYQMTPIYVEELNRIQKMKNVPDSLLYNHLDAFDMKKSIEMFNFMQDAHNPSHSISIAVSRHNPGGNSIGYARKVFENMELMQKWEEVRKELLKYQTSCTDQ